jgi:hypothetical protein
MAVCTEGVPGYSDITNHHVMKHTGCKDYELS